MNRTRLHYIHRNKKGGFSIDKVTQTIVRHIEDKQETYMPYAEASLKGLLGNMLCCWRLRNKKQIFHITGDVHYCIIPLIGCKTVLTIHDTVLLDYFNYGFIKRTILKWLWFKLPIKFASQVVCISEATKASLVSLTNRKDIKIVYDAIDPSFVSKPKNTIGAPPSILLIGTNPNKNLKRTLQALNNIECNVTIIGKPTNEILEQVRDNNIICTWKSGLTDLEVIDEYIKADIVSFISLFEGFGMIVIEANKVGRPVICSNIPVLKEVAGEAALFVDPQSVDDIRNGFRMLISDGSLRDSLVIKGYENVKRFDDQKIRGQWLNLYDNL